MKVIQEQLPNSQVGLKIEISADMSKQTYEKVLQKLIKTANVPGFRRGKVPKQIFLQRFGATQIKAAALEELVQKAVDQAIQQESIEAIGNYQLDSKFDDLIQQYTPGEPLTLEASVDVPPRVTLESYTDITTRAEEIKYSADRIDEVLDQYRLNLATLVPIEDRSAQMGDVAVVDFTGKVQQPDGSYELFEGGSAEDFQLEIKPGGFIDGFVEGIVGMSLDETKDISVTFPEQYPQEELSGKSAIFTITLKELKEKELPDLDDDFAQEVSEFETLAELQASLEERYQKEAVEKTEANQHEALLEALVERLEVEIPETLVRREANQLVSQAVVQLSRQGIDVNKMLTPEIVENMRERSRPDAIARLRRTLALGEVAKQESITVDEADIQARMEEMLSEVRNPQEIDQDRLREVVNEELLQEKILNWLLEKNTVELVPEGTLTSEDNASLEESAEETAGTDTDTALEPELESTSELAAESTLTVEATEVIEPSEPVENIKPAEDLETADDEKTVEPDSATDVQLDAEAETVKETSADTAMAEED